MNGPGTDFYFENADIGSGQLDVAITYNGISIPAQISQTESNKFRISYKPIGSGTYVIKVYYDGQEIQGSPFMMEVIDAKDVKSSGDGLNSGEVGQRSTFYLNLGRDSFPAEIKVNISSPRGNQIQSNVFDRGGGNVVVEFTPTEAGEHLIDVRYFDKPVSGSPFSCQVTDGNQILMLQIPSNGSINRPVEFEIDASRAGQGKLEISVNDGNVPCYVDKQGSQRFRASFTPVEGIPHVVRLRFNDREVPGSPWMVEVRNPASSAVVATNFGNGIAVNQTAEMEVRMSSIDSEVTANVTTPTKSNFPGVVTNLRNGFYRVEYVPREAGTHLVQVLVDGATVPGSPFVFKVYNPNAIFVNPPNVGTIGNPVEFTIDASKAGEGQLEIMVNKGNVSNLTKVIGKGVFLVTFVPMDLRPHLIDVLFNKEPVPNTPLYVPIVDSGGTMVTSQGNTLREVASNRHSIFRLHQNQVMQQQQQQQYQQQQQQAYVEEEMILRVTAPNGELVPSKMTLQPDGDYKLDYMSKYTGRHRVEITSNGQPVMGSPFYVEIYDPNKIKIDGNKRGMVGEQMQFDIIRNQAGKAELKVSIKGPRGNMIRYEMFNTTNGERVWYTPLEPGVYQIYVLFGGLNVPGCPVKQDIFDSSIIIAEGDGLIKGLEDHQTTFYVDPRGQKGELKVQVEGPNSVAKTTVTQDYDGRYEVKYTPMEPGIFMITIRWNGKDIMGSPFRPKISALQKVGVLGGWDSLLDVNNNMTLRIDETKTIDFDARGCGQGQLTASLVGPSGVLPVDVRMKERDIYSVSFTPREEGEYRLKVFWSGQQLDRSPLIGFTKKDNPPANEVDEIYTRQKRSMTSMTAYQTNNQQEGIYSVDKVVLTGIGLQQAVVSQPAEFHIDGTLGGPGAPTVKIDGPSGDVNVQCLPINPCVYKCTYYPPMPGIYSIDIKWADRMVYGSPFKVNAQSIYGTNAAYQVPKNISPYLIAGNPQIGVTPPSDGGNGGNAQSRSVVQNHMASSHLNVVSSSQAGSVTGGTSRAQKAFCTGEGLNGARVGREVKTLINTTRAGNGVLTAQCHGPTRAARCRLLDPNDSGVYQLYIEPLEGGQHNLQIKFNKEHIAGSPFSFKVAYPSDAGKVKCSGTGIRSGMLRNFRGTFMVDTTKAGPGQLGVHVKGPRGGFNTELNRENHNDKKIICSYSPTEPGDYVIRVTWSGDDVPGSPFNIRIADSPAELNAYLQGTYGVSPQERYRNVQ